MREFRRILGYLRPYRGTVLLALVLSFLVAGLTSLSLSTLIPILETLFEEEGLPDLQAGVRTWVGAVSPNVADFLVSTLLTSRMAALSSLLGLVFVMTLMKGALRFGNGYLVGRVAVAGGRDLTNKLFAGLVRQPVLFFEREGVGTIASRFTADGDQVVRALKTITGTMLREPLQFFFLLGLAFLISPLLTLVALVIFPVIGLLTRLASKVAKRNAKGVLEHRSRILSILQEAFFGIRVLQSFRGEEQAGKRFAAENQLLYDRARRLTRVEAATSPLMEVLVVLGVGGALLMGGAMAIRGDLSVSRLVTFYVAVGALYEPVRKIASAVPRIQAGIAGSARIFAYLDRVPEVRETPGARPLTGIGEGIRFHHVTCTYGGEAKALDDVDFEVPPDSWFAVVGPSGSGKSTLGALLPRFFDPEEGAVRLAGTDLRETTLGSLRRLVALVLQESFLLDSSIHANLTLARPEATPEEVREVARIAGVEEFASTLPDGLEARVGERGNALSGGQRQRIAIGRALLANPEVLVLDEATSQVDEENARQILTRIRESRRGRATILITHRVETLVDIPRIAVLRAGRLEALGDHEALLEESPTYRDLVRAAEAARGEGR